MSSRRAHLSRYTCLLEGFINTYAECERVMMAGLLIHVLITMETCQKLASLTLMDSQMMSLSASQGVNMFFMATQHCVVLVAAKQP